MLKVFKIALLATSIAFSGLAAASAEGNRIDFEIGGGIAIAPEYDGAEDYTTKPAFLGRVTALRLGSFAFGGPRDLGLYVSPSFRFLNERESSDDSSLEGIPDVDASFELGGTVGYEWELARMFASARYGVVGHNGWVGELGADIMLPAENMRLTVGPRLSFADSTYFDEYFSVPSTAANLSEFDAGSGIRAVGVEASFRYDINDKWAFHTDARWERLVGDAADSPIVEAGREDQFTAKIGFVRSFSFDF